MNIYELKTVIIKAALPYSAFYFGLVVPKAHTMLILWLNNEFSYPEAGLEDR